jgi:hypothetical protein
LLTEANTLPKQKTLHGQTFLPALYCFITYRFANALVWQRVSASAQALQRAWRRALRSVKKMLVVFILNSVWLLATKQCVAKVVYSVSLIIFAWH